MKLQILGLVTLVSFSSFAADVYSLAERGEKFEIGGTQSYTHDSQCINCGSKRNKKIWPMDGL